MGGGGRASGRACTGMEPWVHEKHGGVRGGLGQGKERGAGCVGGKGRASVGQAGGHALGAGRAGRVEVVGVGPGRRSHLLGPWTIMNGELGP